MTLAPESVVAMFSGFDCEIDGVKYQGILSPFSKAISRSMDIVGLLADSPSEGEAVLADLVTQTKVEIAASAESFNYIVAGAEPAFSTPMEYGGHFLELDRELIGDQKPAITLVGGSETYIDVVSDLAETYLVWNPEHIKEDPQEVAKMTRARILTQVTNFPRLQVGGLK